MDQMDWELLAAEYLEHAENRKGRRENTLRMYKYSLIKWCAYAAGRNPEDLTQDDVEEFAGRPVKGGTTTPAPSTVRRETAAVVGFLGWLVARKRMTCYAHLDVCAPRVKPGVPRPINDDVWRALWLADTVCPDDRLWLGLGYFCGLRRFEIVTIRPEEVFPEDRVMIFERKGGGRNRLDYLAMVASISDELPWLAEGWRDWVDLLESTARAREGEERLSVYAHAEDGFLDGNRLSKRLGRILAAAGLARNSFTIHQLRHSCATNLFRAGWAAEEVQRALSHSSFDITKGYMEVAGAQRARLVRKGVL